MAQSNLLHGREPIYSIADFNSCNENDISITDFCKAVLDGGVQIIQYRDKINEENIIRSQFDKILSIASQYNAVCIINDYTEIALEFHTPVHLGQDDGDSPSRVLTMSFENEDPQLNSETSLDTRISHGRSTHSIKEIEHCKTKEAQPSYIAFGSIFASPLKPDLAEQFNNIAKAQEAWPNDLVLIGGINSENLQTLPKGSQIFYAIVSDFFSLDKGTKGITAKTQELLKLAK